jgi:AcrR family transcriptional regulator
VSTEPRRRLTQDDWTAEALRALAEGGVSAVAIEPLAAQLGATKGSGYWHFANRAALLAATLERWERESTERVLEYIAQFPEPLDRLRALFRTVLSHTGPRNVELALLASVGDPAVDPVLRRVTSRRLEAVADLFRGMGFDRAQAERRAFFAYSAYLGQTQLSRTSPERIPTGADFDAYLDEIVAVVIAR